LEILSEDKESDVKILDVDNDLFDEADNTVEKFKKYSWLNWKYEANNIKYEYEFGNRLSQRQNQQR
jgi:hypothetical protein